MSGNLKSDSKFSLDIPMGSMGNRFSSLLRVPIDYIFEIYDRGKLQMAITLPNSPEAFDCVRTSATNLRYTLGDFPIRQGRENRNREISLSGRSGLESRQGYVRNGNQKFQSGPDILLEFDGFLQDYSALLETRLIESKQHIKESGVKHEVRKKFIEEQPYMVFHALNEKVRLRVEPVNWRWRRSADTSRLSYEWELELKGYGYAPKGGPTNLFAPLDAFMDGVAEVINTVATGLGALANVTGNLRNDINALVGPSLSALRNITRAMQLLSSNVDDLVTFPKSVLANFVATAVEFEDAVFRFSQTVNPFDEELYRTELDTLKRTMETFANEATRTSHIALGATGGGPADIARSQQELRATDISPDPDSVASGTPVVGIPNVTMIVYVIRTGDTLPNLADRALGDSDRWTDIAEANGMAGLHDAGEFGALVPGTRIVLPTTSSNISSNSSVIGADTAEDLLGRDLRIDFRTGDLLTHGTGDISTIRGPGNLEQALALRLLTEQRSLPIFPNYGLPIQPGTGMTSRTATYCGVHCQDQVLSDPRVMEVSDIAVEDGGDSIDVLMNIIPINGGTLEFVAPMKAAGS